MATIIEHETSVPRFVIDLDAPPEERWVAVVKHFAPHWLALMNHLDEQIKNNMGRSASIAESLATSAMSMMTKLGVVYYGDELKSMSKQSGIPLGKLVILQLVYEAAAACTAIIVPGKDGTPLHIRSMDWDMDYLKFFTVEYDFIRKGKLVFQATSWAGFVGILTGMKPNSFSVAVNFRLTQTGSFWENLKEALKRAWPVSFLVREVLTDDDSYSVAVANLANSALIGPCYFTVAGINPMEGVLITRNRGEEEQRWSMQSEGPIIQPNMDHWSVDPDTDIMCSCERRALAMTALSSCKRITPDFLWQVLSRYPICNSITIYGTYMCPKLGILETRLKNSRGSFCEEKDGSNRDKAEALRQRGASICVRCESDFSVQLNEGGGCSHSGEWHSQFSQCQLKCGLGLGVKKLGQCHWSCCFSSEFHSGCKKSGPHQS